MPLQFDLSYDDLLTYRGTNPRPDDFDVFWDKGLAELATVDPQVVLEPSAFEAPFARCEDLYFTGTGETRVHARLVRPREAAGPGPAVLMFHGYGGTPPSWVDLLPYAARGYTVAALDVRGQVGLNELEGFTLRHHVVDGLDEARSTSSTGTSSWTRNGWPTSYSVWTRSTPTASRPPATARAAHSAWSAPRSRNASACRCRSPSSPARTGPSMTPLPARCLEPPVPDRARTERIRGVTPSQNSLRASPRHGTSATR
jgi:hypothetical protein